MRRIPSVFRLLAVVLAAAWPALALAAETATVIGTVTDASGAAVPGVVVTARNVDTGITRSATTSADGAYRIPVLPPGRYEVTAELSGFATARRQGVRLMTGHEATIHFEMKPASVTEELTVTADSPLIETTNATVSTVIDREQVELLPLIGRDFIDILRTVPGVAGGDNILGARERSNTFLLDGVDNAEDISGFRRQDFNLNAIQEFQVLTNNFKAEYGRASGGVVQVLSRSGTNEFHGGLFLLYRDQSMMARDPFRAAGTPNDPFKRRHYGGYLGGPIKKDRTHFFTSLDYQDRDTFSTSTYPIPPAGAVISPAVAALLAQNDVPPFPDPSQGRTVRLVRDEFINFPKWSLRMDHALNEKQSLTFRLTYENDSEPSGFSGTIYDTRGAYADYRTIYGNVNHKWIRSATHLNELYVQVGQTKGAWSATFPGLVNIFVDEYSTANPYLGGPTNYPQGRTDYVYQLIDNYTINVPSGWRGSHVFKFGGDVKVFKSNSFFDSNFRGSYFFRTVSDFLAGNPRRFTQNRGDTTLARPNTGISFYAQDDWRLNEKLTLNLGLRYDLELGKTEALRDIPPGSPVCPLSGACGEAGPGISRDRNNVAPRFGFVWDPMGDGKTAVHGGAGIYYDQIILNIQGNARFTPPKVIGVQIENPPFPDPFAGGGSAATIVPNVSVIDPDLKTPKSLNMSLGVKREITRNLAVDLTYVRNRGSDQVLIRNVNAIDPATRARPNPNFTNISFYTNLGEIHYDALLVEVKKRMSRRHQWSVSYTLASTKNHGETFVTGLQDPRNLAVNWGPAELDQRHTLVINGMVRLPLGVDLAAIMDYRSQRPWDVFAGGRDLNGDGITGDYPDGLTRNGQRGITLEETNRLRAALNLAPLSKIDGNVDYFNIDATMRKRFGIGGDRKIGVSLEVFNLLNHKNVLQPTGNLTSSLFGQHTAINGNMRSVQLTAEFDF